MPLQASFSSSSSFTYGWEYDVFLSFRGPDTRLGFIGHLYKALCYKGIRTFIDDEELQRGEEITPSLIKAIEESRIAIPVFSKNYASSSFCLDELVKIMDCVKGNDRLVLPVFYEVDPSEVRQQIGSYKGALAKHEQRYKHHINKVRTWRAALRQAAALSGHHLKLGVDKECDFIDRIVKEISKRISRQPLHIADYPVGLESRVIEVKQLLYDGSDDGVHTVGIYGIGGIGKSTLTRAVYNSIADLFDHLCFLENLSQLFKIHDVPYVQKMLLSKILGKGVDDFRSENELISIIKKRLQGKKVLLVLDNVDKREQLKALIGSPNWLGSGSRVMITTRDKHLLTEYGVEKIYEVGVLNEKEASELFTWKTFKSNQVKPCYMDIFNELVQYASGLPLALEVMGSNLFEKSVREWTCALDVYKKIPDENVQEKLKLSFDALHPQEKDIFLDIACCFNGYHRALVEDILHAHYNVGPTYSIGMLVDKSLVKIGWADDVIRLHDLIQDMGREIVRQESEKEPGERSRLWFAEDIIKVLQEDRGSRKIQIIHLDFGYNDNIIEWKGHAFKKMKELKTLIIKRGQFSQGPTYLPQSLKVLIWQKYPSQQDLQCYFHPKELVILHLPTNHLDSVQLARLLKKELVNMKVLIFDGCEGITKIPNVSSAPKLEELSFIDCKNLSEIDRSVGSLPKLKILNAKGCNQLRSFPPLLLPSLEQLELSGCSTLESFPEILGKMGSMSLLYIDNISNIKFPHSIHYLTELSSFMLESSETVVLPSSINLLPKLNNLYFHECKSVVLSNEDEGEQQVSAMPPSLPISLIFSNCDVSEQLLRTTLSMFTHIEELSFSEAFRILPECINEFHFLKKLYLGSCHKLEEIQGIPPNIETLNLQSCRLLSYMTRKMLLNKKLHEECQFKEFVLPGKRLPKWFEHRRRGSLPYTFWVRNKLPSLILGICTPPTIKFSHAYKWMLQLTSNGENKSETLCYTTPSGHISILSKLNTSLRNEVAPSENEWIRVVIFAYNSYLSEGGHIEFGAHIMNERGGRMDDIQFSHPTKREGDTSMEQQVQMADPLSLPLSLLFDHLDSNSHQIITTTPTLRLPGVWCRWLCDMLCSLVSLCSSSSSMNPP